MINHMILLLLLLYMILMVHGIIKKSEVEESMRPYFVNTKFLQTYIHFTYRRIT